MAWDLTNEIAAQQDAVANTLAGSCVIERVTLTSDGQGGFTQAFAAVGTADCRIVANSGNTKITGATFERVGDYTITLASGTDVEEQDRIIKDGINYRVLFVDDVRDWQTAARVQANLEIS